MAMHGQGGPPERRSIRDEEQLRKYFAEHGRDYETEFEEARGKDAVVGLLTVHLGTDMMSSLAANLPRDGKSFVAFGNPEEGFTYLKGGPGHIVAVQHVDSFDYAAKNLDRCVGVEKPDYRDLLSSFASGMASIEGFLNDRIRRHLPFFITGGDEILRKTNVETKVFDWLPKLYPHNRTVDKGGSSW